MLVETQVPWDGSRWEVKEQISQRAKVDLVLTPTAPAWPSTESSLLLPRDVSDVPGPGPGPTGPISSTPGSLPSLTPLVENWSCILEILIKCL